MSDTPADEASPAERWFRLAEQDLEAAKVLLADGSAAMRIAAFLSQQAAENALKAGLIAVGVHPPHIHGLRQLYDARFLWWRPISSYGSATSSSSILG